MAGDALDAAVSATVREQLLAALRDYPLGMHVLSDKLGALRQAIDVLSRNQVAYALIGGLAVGVRSGVPRATLDVDLAVSSQVDRARLTEWLVAAGFVLRGSFAHSLNFEHPSGEPVQLAFDAGFDPMIERAELMRFGSLEIKVVTTDDLIAMKRRAAADPARRRSKALRDQADVLLLEGDVPEPGEGW